MTENIRKPDECIAVARESVEHPDVLELIRKLDAHLDAGYPKEAQFGLSVDALQAEHIRFFVARDKSRDGKAVGCCGVKLFDDYAELSRLWVPPDERGCGIADALVLANEATARTEGQSVMRLETGKDETAAYKFYKRLGYEVRGPFADYTDNGYSLFMEKKL